MSLFGPNQAMQPTVDLRTVASRCLRADSAKSIYGRNSVREFHLCSVPTRLLAFA